MKENYKKFIDPNIKRKSEIIQNSLQFDKDNKVPLFSLVEISDSGTCNRACSFCPRSDKDWIDKFEILKVSHNNEIQLKKNILKLYKSKNHRKKYDLRMFDFKKNCEAITRIYRKILVD